MDVEGVFVGGVDAGAGGEVGEFFKGGDELGAAVGVTGVVDGIDAEKNIEGVGGLGECEGEAEEDGVAAGT